jgi:hypothetical protein
MLGRAAGWETHDKASCELHLGAAARLQCTVDGRWVAMQLHRAGGALRVICMATLAATGKDLPSQCTAVHASQASAD